MLLDTRNNFMHEVTQLTPINRSFEINVNNTYFGSHIFAFNLGQTIREGDVYTKNMTWDDQEDFIQLKPKWPGRPWVCTA